VVFTIFVSEIKLRGGGKMSRTCRTHGEMRNASKILVEKSEESKSLGRPRNWCEDNIEIDLKVRIGSCGGSCEHGAEPFSSIKGGNVLMS
jgi:hypothetical protein